MGKKVTIIGTGMGFYDFTRRHLGIIEKAELLIGGERHLSDFKDLTCEKLPVKKNLSKIIEIIDKERADKNIVVLASGDPLYFGIGSYLAKKIGKDNVEILPNINSVSAAFSKIKESWSDVYPLSLHGREFNNQVFNIFRNNDKIAVFTDETRTPSFISEKLIEEKIDWFDLYVFENMGSDNEISKIYTLDEARSRKFSDLNIAVFISKESMNNLKNHFGLPEDEFIHEKGLITKSEVRAVTISKLRLNEDSVMWDLGAGSGSVSIEASLFAKKGRVIALEKNKNRVSMIEQNKDKFSSSVEIKNTSLPDGMDDLPDPDRVFIGGGGKDLDRIMEKSIERLKENGIIVINTVVMKSFQTAVKILENYNIKPEIVQLQINRAEPIAGDFMMKSLNPVWIITGQK